MMRGAAALAACALCVVAAPSSALAHEGEAQLVAQRKEETDKPSVPWIASFDWSQGFAAKGLGVNGYQTYDPDYYWGFLVTAGYKFSAATALTLSEYATVELTKSDSTTKPQQLLFYNPSVDLSHTLNYEPRPEQALSLKGSVGLILPTSTTTQSSTFIVGTNTFGARGRLAAGYKWKEVLNGFELRPGFGYQRRFNTANTIAVQNPYPCNLVGGAGPGDCSQLGSLTTTRDVFLLGLDSAAELTDKWIAAFSFTFYFTRGRDLAPANFMDSTGATFVIADTSRTHWRNLRWMVVSLGYKLTSWLTLSGQLINIFSERDAMGNLRGVFNPLDTILGLDLEISFDQLYLGTRAHGGSQR
jgi:hypothetical protein